MILIQCTVQKTRNKSANSNYSIKQKITISPVQCQILSSKKYSRRSMQTKIQIPYHSVIFETSWRYCYFKFFRFSRESGNIVPADRRNGKGAVSQSQRRENPRLRGVTETGCWLAAASRKSNCLLLSEFTIQNCPRIPLAGKPNSLPPSLSLYYDCGHLN